MKDSQVVLVAMTSGESLRQLREELRGHATEIIVTHDCSDARRLLSSRSDITVVVCGVRLVDGDWTDLLTWVVDWRLGARVVVSSPLVDEQLWSEVFWRGGFDVLVEPYKEGEVQRVIDNATRGLRRERLSAAR